MHCATHSSPIFQPAARVGSGEQLDCTGCICAGGNADKSDDSISAAADGAQRVYGTCRTGQSFQYGFTKADGLMPGVLAKLCTRANLEIRICLTHHNKAQFSCLR